MSVCKGCQAPLVWILGRKNKPIPLEPAWVDVVPAAQGEHCFAVMLADGEVLQRMRRRQPGDGPYAKRGRILHHATCPERERFSRREKKTGTPLKGDNHGRT
jgi:hypothetical protein